jgi:hypothetical protein
MDDQYPVLVHRTSRRLPPASPPVPIRKDPVLVRKVDPWTLESPIKGRIMGVDPRTGTKVVVINDPDLERFTPEHRRRLVKAAHSAFEKTAGVIRIGDSGAPLRWVHTEILDEDVITGDGQTLAKAGEWVCELQPPAVVEKVGGSLMDGGALLSRLVTAIEKLASREPVAPIVNVPEAVHHHHVTVEAPKPRAVKVVTDKKGNKTYVPQEDL